MNTLRSIYFWVFALLVILYGLFEYYRPKPLNWNPTYSNKDYIPFGTQVLYELLPDIFGNQSVKSLRLPIYNHLAQGQTSTVLTNYIFVCNRFIADRNDQKRLFDYVKRGNHAFISAYDFPENFVKVLGIKANLKDPSLKDSALVVNFVHPTLKKSQGYVFSHDDGRNYFEVANRKHVTVLAENARGEPIFLKVKYGQGYFYLHNLPIALTNYYVLDKKNSDFSFKCLSYLPVRAVFWDEYMKQGRFGDTEQSSLRYILSQPSLRWAYYLGLIGLLFFAIFGGKRTQRVIPVLETPKNISLEFVQTIGKVYFQQAQHSNVAHKKIQHFLAFIREQYGVKTASYTQELKTFLAEKTGIAQLDIDLLFGEIAYAERNTSMTEFELLSLNQRIEDFYKHVKG